MAVGASGRNITTLIARRGGIPVLAGLIAGFLSALALTRYLSSFLYGVAPGDPATFGIAAVILLCAAALAMILPAKRASRVDPMIALRTE